MIGRRIFSLLALVTVSGGLLRAEEKKEENPVPPQVKMAIPFALVLGETNSFTIRGLNLTNTTAIKFLDHATNIHAEIKSRGKAEIPKSLEAKDVGDTQIEASVVLPKDFPAGRIQFVIESPEPATAPASLLLVASTNLTREIEPNGGFKSAQKISIPQTVLGTIKEPSDVDVFQFTLTGPTALKFSIIARQFASQLDSILTLYDSRGHLLASNDDFSRDERDSQFSFSFKTGGEYFISVIDAHDQGGAAHLYCLTVASEK